MPAQEPQDEEPNALDRLVDALARALDALGLNGTRLRWKWNQRRGRLAEAGARTANLWRSSKGRHKMCRVCRALVDRNARQCPECDADLAAVRAPGMGRLLSNVLPGATAATSLILLANGFWFVLTLMAHLSGSGGSAGGGLLVQFPGELLFRVGSGYSPATLSGEWWRLVTPIFLHGGLLHFAFNSYVLLQLGPVAEEEFGTERFWCIYLACGLAGSALSQLSRPVNTVGASGAIVGLMGLLLVYGWRRGGALGESLKQGMLRYALYIVVFSLLIRGVDHINHAGGFVCGAILALLVPAGRYRNRGEASVWQLVAAAGVLLVLLAFYRVAAGGGLV